MIINTSPAFTFDDLTLIPAYSRIKSRFSEEIDLSTTLIPQNKILKLKYPIISANMDTVTGPAMAREINRLGGLGIMHRFLPTEEHRRELSRLEIGWKVLCIGVDQSSRERLELCLDWFTPDAILIDIAHGDCQAMEQMIKHVKTICSQIPIIAGNIATHDAAQRLISAGASALKVGISPGSLCSTRVMTGCGVPQLTAIMDVAQAIREVNTPITLIADGGIRDSGDMVKALAAGAHAVMLGNLFAGCTETPGDVIYHPTPCKVYRGMASKEAQLSWKGSFSSIEGESLLVPLKGPVEDVFRYLVGGIRSGFAYLNACNIQELQQNAIFRLQTHAGWLEGTPHGIKA